MVFSKFVQLLFFAGLYADYNIGKENTNWKLAFKDNVANFSEVRIMKLLLFPSEKKKIIIIFAILYVSLRWIYGNLLLLVRCVLVLL